jgi:hypothetical protein
MGGTCEVEPTREGETEKNPGVQARVCSARRPSFLPLEVAHQLLLLGVDRDHGLAALHERLRGAIDVLELCAAVGRLLASAFIASDFTAAQNSGAPHRELADPVGT